MYNMTEIKNYKRTLNTLELIVHCRQYITTLLLLFAGHEWTKLINGFHITITFISNNDESLLYDYTYQYNQHNGLN